MLNYLINQLVECQRRDPCPRVRAGSVVFGSLQSAAMALSRSETTLLRRLAGGRDADGATDGQLKLKPADAAGHAGDRGLSEPCIGGEDDSRQDNNK